MIFKFTVYIFIVLVMPLIVVGQNQSKIPFEEVIQFCKLTPNNGDSKKGLIECIESSYFPNFDLKDIYGKEIYLDKMKNITIINYWFINCPPCNVEKKYLKEISDKFPHIDVISVGLDTKKDILLFKNKNELPDHWKYISDSKSKNIYDNGFGYPLTIIVTNKGKILKFLIGGIQTEKLSHEIQSFLEKVKN